VKTSINSLRDAQKAIEMFNMGKLKAVKEYVSGGDYKLYLESRYDGGGSIEVGKEYRYMFEDLMVKHEITMVCFIDFLRLRLKSFRA
jgi:hypothetical protein